MRGGTIMPSSSAWAMMAVPMRRVLTPQLVVQANSCVFWRERNWMPLALAKFWPRKWEVPAWMALRSWTMASMVRVRTAPGKRSDSRFFAREDGDGEVIAGEGGVDFEHLLGLGDGLGLGFVGGMAFLPEEFRGAEEDAGAHFPADDVGPLVDEDGEVAVGLDPLGVGGADDGLAGGADDEGLGQFGGRGRAQAAGAVGLEAMMGDDGAFLGEALDVLRLPLPGS